ncbi:MAG: hypothetical protein JWQ40_4794 [Segetibacter sp.]|nr:hypothetical protein [Segetibacter sp.]
MFALLTILIVPFLLPLIVLMKFFYLWQAELLVQHRYV